LAAGESGVDSDRVWLSSLGATLGTLSPGSAAKTGPAFEGVKFERAKANPESGETYTNTALEWLSRNQEADGHWDSVKFGAEVNADIEQTALAMLAFLARGHTEKVGKFKDNVRRAGEWLCKNQRADGAICRQEGEFDGITHAIAALAITELAAAMTKKAERRDQAQKAMDYSTNIHQTNKDGKKWGFGRKPNSQKPDLFTTTFFASQIVSAKYAGLRVPPETVEGMLQFVNSLKDEPKKTFRFETGGTSSARANLMGCLCQQLLGYKNEETEPTARMVLEYFTSGSEINADALMLYWGASVCNKHGGGWMAAYDGSGIWLGFRKTINPKIFGARRKDGSAEGSCNPNGTWAGAGRVLSTALNELSIPLR
jgi:prenyltransferase beta subunit